MPMLEKVEKPLTPKERKFLRCIIVDNMSETDAYLAVSNQAKLPTRQSAGELGSRMFRRIKKKAEFQEVLRAGGLDYVRLVRKLSQLLDAKRVEMYQGEVAHTCEDGFVQTKAAELLAELLGLRKGQVDIRLPGNAYGVLVVPGRSQDRNEWADRAREQQNNGGNDQE